MTLWSISLIVPLVLIIMGAVPARWLNLQPLMQCRWATRIALLPVISTGVLCYLVATEGEGYVQLASFGGLVWSATVDGLSLIMLWLISLLGLVVARFSVNYLDGESCQGEFSRGLLLTLGSVLWLVVSANLLMLWIAWVLTSLGIQRLLLLHPGRRRAVLAGRQKFIISRLSEASLFIAVVMCNHLYGTLEIPQLLSWVPESPDAARSGLIWVALPLALAAMIRSVQFPCHTWLPETMETPTPVSALMHAGVVNAGGVFIDSFGSIDGERTSGVNLAEYRWGHHGVIRSAYHADSNQLEACPCLLNNQPDGFHDSRVWSDSLHRGAPALSGPFAVQGTCILVLRKRVSSASVWCSIRALAWAIAPGCCANVDGVWTGHCRHALAA
ncbi:MAG: hypothetical protein KatS3mg113_0408 [Planctomycetaceae bacterium]|nr:MAG: hypothetical protein KatS3mg113_0408 [Planctomycetaceae bacterium]